MICVLKSSNKAKCLGLGVLDVCVCVLFVLYGCLLLVVDSV